MKHLPPHTLQHRIDSPLGGILLARTPHGLSGLWFDGQKDHPGPLALPHADDDPLFRQVAWQLDAYWQGRLTDFDLPLDLHGTPFQRAVWQALQEVRGGQTASYSEIAGRIGTPRAVRAVGAAVGRNPVSIVVPCHRILGRSGSLTGYAGGLPRKQALLVLEGILAPEHAVATQDLWAPEQAGTKVAA